MPDYKAIHGKNMLHLASDLDSAEAEGQIWYNTASTDYKTIVKAAGAWSTGATVGTARAALEGADGSSVPAGLIFAGRTSGSAGGGETEEYDGSSWSEQDDLNVNRWRGGGAGTQTAGFSFAGSTGPTAHVKTAETYNGSSWTEVPDVNSNHVNTIGFGTTTAAFCVAGNSGTANVTIVEEYDGSSWSETTDINTARNAMAGCGTTTAAIISGGETPGARVANAEQWNGTAWTEVGDINEARIHLGGAGISSACISFGGEPGPGVSAKTEQWDDSSWTEIADLSTARARGGSGGDVTSAFLAAGATPSATAGVNPTEEWDFTQTRAAGAWASGGALNDGRGQMGNVGDIPAALVMGGYSPNKATCESYDGSSWTEEDDLNTGRQYCAAFGSTTAALVVGGNPAAVDATETWNGSSWTTNPATLASGRQKFGTSNRSPSTSGLIFAGQNTGGPPWYSVILTESWDGSSWTEEPDVNTHREAGGSVGTQTACLLIAGHRSDSPPGARTHVESWNGSSWSEGPDVNTGRQSVCCSGTTTSALIGGGTAPPATAITEQYDGTSWTEVADLSAAREGLAKGAGASGHSCLAAGVDGSPNTIVEEWTQPQNIKIITD